MNANSISFYQFQPLLFQKLKQLYKRQLNQELTQITCRVFEKTLVILLEGTITQPERLLAEHQNKNLAKQVRESLDQVIQPQIKKIIENVMPLKVIDFLSDTTLENNCTGAIVIFELKSCSENAINLSTTEVQKLGVNDDVKPVLNPSINKV
jgi:uncharacterized protein YbcI